MRQSAIAILIKDSGGIRYEISVLAIKYSGSRLEYDPQPFVTGRLSGRNLFSEKRAVRKDLRAV